MLYNKNAFSAEKISDILKLAQKSGMKPEEIAEKLGISMER